MKNNTIAGHIVHTLLEQNFTRFYCLPGVQNDDFFNVLYDHKDTLTPIHTRHEQGAAYMALGAGLATGKPQVFCIVPGPGFLNGATALATAYSANVPVLALIGNIPSGAVNKDFGLLHEIPNQTQILHSLTKKTISLTSGTDAKSAISDAFITLKSGVQRPVGLEVPMNVWNQSISDITTDMDMSPLVNPQLDKTQIDMTVQMIQNANRPLILVGGGALNASAEITALAEKIQSPVGCHRMGHGVVSDRNPLSISLPVCHRLWADVDLVIGLGTRLQQCEQWGMDENIQSIHVDLNPDRLNNMFTADVTIHADCTDFCNAILPLLPQKTDTEQWSATVAQVKSDFNAEIKQQLAPQLAYINAIRAVLPDDGIYVEDLTQVSFVARFAYPTYKPRTFISHGYQGTLGWGIATSLGVADACPDVPVVSVNGDGGFMFTMPEIATAVYHNIPLNIIVFNDNAFGNVKRFQRDKFDNRTLACDLANPDFVQMATSFGISATRVTTPEQLESQLQQDITINAPTFIEVAVGEFPSPWQHIVLKHVRGDTISPNVM